MEGGGDVAEEILGRGMNKEKMGERRRIRKKEEIAYICDDSFRGSHKNTRYDEMNRMAQIKSAFDHRSIRNHIL